MTLPFKVYSQTRSGTHLALATLDLNFDFGDLTLFNVKVPNHTFHANGKSWNAIAPVPWGRLFGGHYSCRAGLLPAVYVVRHPITRMYSLWKFGRQEETFEEFAVPYRFALWKTHVDSWRGNAVIVRYEDLRIALRVNAVLERLEDQFDLTHKGPWTYVNERVGWSPTYGVLDYCPQNVVDIAVDVLGEYFFDYHISNWRGT